MGKNDLKIVNNELYVENFKISEIAKKFGTPLYIYNYKKIVDIICAYKKALEENYGYGQICYASKAFSCKEIYRIINEQNIGADIVSGGELFTARSVDFPCQKLVFHGNNKSEQEIHEAIESNVGLIVIDSFSEAKKIDVIAKKLNKIQNVLIRVNPGIEAHTHQYIQTSKIDSKFGFSIESGEAISVIKDVLLLKNIKLLGLHCHIGSQIFEVESFLLAVEKVLSFYNDIKEKLNYQFETLDLGGGFGIWYNDEDKKMSLDDYYNFIKQIIDKVNQCIKLYQLKKPFLIFEPGRSIVGEAGLTLYTIGSVKEIKNVKTYLNIDGGMFENPRFALYNAKYTIIAPTKMNNKCDTKYSIAGKCCESGDKIREDCYLPKMEEGELLAVLSTGAYNYSMASNYNRNLIPPVVFVNGDKIYYAVKPQLYLDLTRNDV